LSKYIQIEVKFLAVYGPGGLKAAFPNLYNLLNAGRYDLVIEKEPSLYEMVDVLVRVGNDPHVAEVDKKPVREALGELVKVRDQARELLLSRRLSELDRLLYRLEDLFGELERRLG
jgi:hypothetical protein